jgi:hypothetical protein
MPTGGTPDVSSLPPSIQRMISDTVWSAFQQQAAQQYDMTHMPEPAGGAPGDSGPSGDASGGPSGDGGDGGGDF